MHRRYDRAASGPVLAEPVRRAARVRDEQLRVHEQGQGTRPTLNELLSSYCTVYRTVYSEVRVCGSERKTRRGRGACTQAEGVGYRGRVLLELRTRAEQERQLVDGKLVVPPTTPVLFDAHPNDVLRANVRANSTSSRRGIGELVGCKYSTLIVSTQTVHSCWARRSS